jgi:hypothetical protein
MPQLKVSSFVFVLYLFSGFFIVEEGEGGEGEEEEERA